MIIECSKCGVEFDKWHVSGRRCKPCVAAEMRVYYRKHHAKLKRYNRARDRIRRANPAFVERQRVRGRAYWAKLRQEAILAYGGYRCACCGVTEPKFLTLDHVFNDGSAHRKLIRNRGSGIFKWLRDHGYPAGFQVLCMNCNHGKAMNGGVCPHKAPTHANRVNSGEVQTGQSRAKPTRKRRKV